MKDLLIILILIPPLAVFGQGNTFEKHEKFDDNGNLIEHIGLTPNGEIAERYFNEYDSLNRLVKTYKVEAGSSEKLWINTYEYDDNSLVIRRNWFPSEKMILYQYETYNYDSNGNKIERLKYIPDNRLVFRETWEYDENGMLRVHKEEFLEYVGDRIIDK